MAIMLQPCRSLLKRIVLTNSLDTCATQHAIYVQPSRGVRSRKPFLLGLARTKWFKVPERPQFTPEEQLEIRNLIRLYNCQFNSICAFLKNENALRAEGSKMREDELRAEEEEWQRCMTINNAWNKEVEVEREKRFTAERKERQQRVLEDIIQQRERQQKLKEEVDAFIRKEKELSASYITEENVDEAIAKAIDKTVDFNFCLDYFGNIHKGRLAKPEKRKDTSDEGQVDGLVSTEEKFVQRPVTHASTPSIQDPII